MNAKEARDITNKVPQRKGQSNSYEEIKSTIQTMSKYGFFSMSVKNISVDVKKRLETEGYVVNEDGVNWE